MRFRVLGPLQVWDGARWTTIRAAQQRVVLAVLLLDAGRVVGADRLVDELWGDKPPATAVNTVQGYVMRLRRLLGDQHGDRLVTRRPGYELLVDDKDLDAAVFEGLAARGQQQLAASRLDGAASDLAEALGLWRAQAFADVPPTPLVTAGATRLEQLRLATLEGRIEAELGMGRHDAVLAELERLVEANPLRERLRAQLMLALHRSGRSTDALAVYARGRRLLVNELGLEPGPELRRLEEAIRAEDRQIRVAAAVPASPSTAAASAPPAPAQPVPAQLPADLPAFTGRVPHMVQLDALLSSDGTATGTAVVISAIAGTAGVGKTALAVHWAHRVRDRFADGQLYANLRGYAPTEPMRPIEALAQFLHALGVPGRQVPVDVDAAAALYRTILAGKRVLVLLDNAHSAEQVRPLLPASPRSVVVITSRDRLSGLVARDGARRLTLDVLTLPEAVALLARVLGAERVRTEPAAASALAVACANLPLALRIVAERAAAEPQSTLATLAGQLADERARLDVLSAEGDDLATVRTVFSWSVQALPADAARVFQLLGLHAGPDISVAAAAALTGLDVAETRALLDALTSGHLLERTGEERYEFHDLLRAYAAERAVAEEAAAERAAAIRRVHAWYLLTADAAGRVLMPQRRPVPLEPSAAECQALAFASHGEALAWCEAELANLVATTRQAADVGAHAIAWQLPAALWAFLYLRKPWSEWITSCRIGLSSAQLLGDRFGEAWMLFGLGAAHRDLRRFAETKDYYERALVLWREIGDRYGEAMTLNNLGAAHCDVGQFEDGLEHFQRALDVRREIGDRRGEGQALSNIGEVRRDLRRFGEALVNLREALQVRREIGDRYGEASTLNNLGELYRDLRRYDEALDHYEQALQVRREIGARQGEAETLCSRAEALHDLGRRHEARASWRAALAIFAALGAPQAAEVRDRLTATVSPL